MRKTFVTLGSGRMFELVQENENLDPSVDRWVEVRFPEPGRWWVRLSAVEVRGELNEGS